MKHLALWMTLILGIAFAHYAPGLTLSILLVAGPAALLYMAINI